MREGDTLDALDALMLTEPEALHLAERLADAARQSYEEIVPHLGPELARQIIVETYSGDMALEEIEGALRLTRHA